MRAFLCLCALISIVFCAKETDFGTAKAKTFDPIERARHLVLVWSINDAHIFSDFLADGVRVKWAIINSNFQVFFSNGESFVNSWKGAFWVISGQERGSDGLYRLHKVFLPMERSCGRMCSGEREHSVVCVARVGKLLLRFRRFSSPQTHGGHARSLPLPFQLDGPRSRHETFLEWIPVPLPTQRTHFWERNSPAGTRRLCKQQAAPLLPPVFRVERFPHIRSLQEQSEPGGACQVLGVVESRCTRLARQAAMLSFSGGLWLVDVQVLDRAAHCWRQPSFHPSWNEDQVWRSLQVQVWLWRKDQGVWLLFWPCKLCHAGLRSLNWCLANKKPYLEYPQIFASQYSSTFPFLNTKLNFDHFERSWKLEPRSASNRRNQLKKAIIKNLMSTLQEKKEAHFSRNLLLEGGSQCLTGLTSFLSLAPKMGLMWGHFFCASLPRA